MRSARAKCGPFKALADVGKGVRARDFVVNSGSPDHQTTAFAAVCISIAVLPAVLAAACSKAPVPTERLVAPTRGPLEITGPRRSRLVAAP
jgi:hypothetical protein